MLPGEEILPIRLANARIQVPTDIGCEWDGEWLTSLVTPLLKDNSLDLVIGNFR
jgi:hypothetical protein